MECPVANAREALLHLPSSGACSSPVDRDSGKLLLGKLQLGVLITAALLTHVLKKGASEMLHSQMLHSQMLHSQMLHSQMLPTWFARQTASCLCPSRFVTSSSAEPYSFIIRSATRSFALRDLGLESISCWLGLSGFFVSTLKQPLSRKAFLTIRSSSE